MNKIKHLVAFTSMLLPMVYCPGQVTEKKVDPYKMLPGMVEVWEPEVEIIKAGATNQEPPSDAIVLFEGSDINKEWEDTKGNPSKWIVKDGVLISVRGSGFSASYYLLVNNCITVKASLCNVIHYSLFENYE